MNTFTEAQLIAFRAFVRVQKTSKLNMMDPRARQVTNLTEKQWVFCIDNYAALKAQNEAEK
jgi:hypothetical protein